MKRIALTLAFALIGFISYSQEVKVSNAQNASEAAVLETELPSEPAAEVHAPSFSTIDASQFDMIGAPFFLQYPGMAPFMRSYSNSGYFGASAGLGFFGANSYDDHPFLLVSRSASAGISRNYGKLGMLMSVTAANHVAMGMPSFYQGGINMMLEYRLTDYASVVAFGQLYNNAPYATMAILPYVGTTRVGGYVSLTGDVMGIDLGVQRYFNPVMHRWMTSPIITPKIKVNDDISIGVSVSGVPR